MLFSIFGLQGVDFVDQGVCNLGFRFLFFFSHFGCEIVVFVFFSWDWDARYSQLEFWV